MNDPLAELLSSRVRAAVLTRFVADPAAASLTELARALDLSISSVQHECYKLERLGVLTGRREGGSRRYYLSRDSPLVEPLTALVRASRDSTVLLGEALRTVAGIERALLVPPAAEGVTYLVLIGEVALDELDGVAERTAALLTLPLDRLALAFYRPDDWRARIAEGHPLVQRLLAAPHVVLVGDDEP
ncbi:MAG: winged helix-turn-helix transcriptional regulator [Chloroflexia bacterium]|nr:winged helix-turn-helix transcriptional regulator [Chloroflexia bacterium]